MADDVDGHYDDDLYDSAEVDTDEDDGPPAMSIGGDPTGLPRHLARVTAADGRVQYVSDLTTINTLRAMGGVTVDTACEVRTACDGADAVAEVSGTLVCAACEPSEGPDDVAKEGYEIVRQLDPSERHPYWPSKTDGQCLYRMPDSTLCQLKDPDAWHHQVPKN